MSDTAVSAFYSPPNEVDPEQLDGQMGELLRLLVTRLGTPARTLIPARVAGSSRWYGVAPSDRDARLLREELRCWLGPPISSRITSIVAPTDTVDQASLGLVSAATVVRIDVAPGWQAEARESVAALLEVWALTPARGVDQPRPVGRVLRQFYESLLAADRVAAEAALDEIKTRALLEFH